jgi:hypothetical protein
MIIEAIFGPVRTKVESLSKRRRTCGVISGGGTYKYTNQLEIKIFQVFEDFQLN